MAITNSVSIGSWLTGLLAESQTCLGATGRPLVTLSYAQSLDGSLAAQSGQGLALSGPQSLQLTHRLRAAHAAILVGIGTLLADDPQLTVRLAHGPDPRPVVLDTHLRIPLDCRLLQRTENLPWIFCGQEAAEQKIPSLQALGARVMRLPLSSVGGLNLLVALNRLGELGIASVMVEGGSQVIESFLAQRLFDYALLTIAPVWVGGLKAAVHDLSRAGVFPGLDQPHFEVLGRDLVVWGKRAELVLS